MRPASEATKEVPRWSRENHCFSCHNNGDAARALYAALRAGLPLPVEALADTNRWLAEPERWDHNGGEGPFSDKRLARLQFSFSLAAADAAGQVASHAVLVRAAVRLTADQADDGAFLLEGGDSLGSPATYGRSLATLVLRDTLRAASPRTVPRCHRQGPPLAGRVRRGKPPRRRGRPSCCRRDGHGRPPRRRRVPPSLPRSDRSRAVDRRRLGALCQLTLRALRHCGRGAGSGAVRRLAGSGEGCRPTIATGSSARPRFLGSCSWDVSTEIGSRPRRFRRRWP